MSEVATAVALEKEKEEKKGRRARGEGRIWQRGAFWWIQYYDQRGRQIRESSGSSTEQVAKRLLKRRLGERELGILPDPKTNRVTVAELYEDKHAQLTNQGKLKTAEWMKSRWELRLKNEFEARRARDVRLAELVDYQTKQMERYRDEFPDASTKKLAAKETSVNSDLDALRMMFYCGKKLEKVAAVRTFPDPLAGALERQGTVTREQFERMLAACEPDELWLKTFLTMAYTWGYRLRELLNLQCGRVNLKERTVYLPPRSTKNKMPRLVPISDQEIAYLQTCIEGKGPADFVFTWPNGARVRDFRARWERIVKKANAGHAEIDLEGRQTWYRAIVHDFRRTAISRMLSGGMPPEAVRTIVGHITPAMTQRYYRPAVETLRRMQQAADVRLENLTNGDKIGTIGQLPEKTEAQIL